MKARKKKTISIKDILKGKFLVEKGSARNWSFMVFGIALAFLGISSSHWLDTKTVKLHKLKNEVAELKSRYADVHDDLMQAKLEKNIAPIVRRDSIFTSNKQPILLIRE